MDEAVWEAPSAVNAAAMSAAGREPRSVAAASKAMSATKAMSPRVGSVDAVSEPRNLGSATHDAVPEVPSVQPPILAAGKVAAPKVTAPKQKKKRSSRAPKPLGLGEVLSMLVSGKYRGALKTAAARVKRDVDHEEERAKRDKHRSGTKAKAKPKRKRHSGAHKKHKTTHGKKHKRRH